MKLTVEGTLGGVLALLLGLTGLPAYAEDLVEASHAKLLHAQTNLTLNPGALLFSNRLPVELERAVSDSVASYVRAAAIIAGFQRKVIPAGTHPFFNNVDSSGVNAGLNGAELEVGLRFYVTGSAPAGLFIGPFGNVSFVWGKQGEGAAVQSASGWGVAVGAMLGYSFLIANVVDLSLGFGAQWHHEQLNVGATRTFSPPHKDTAEGQGSLVKLGITPVARVAVGWAF